MSRDPSLYLKDMRDACARIKAHTAGRNRQQVLGDAKTRDATLWNLLVIGEAAKQVPPEIRAKHGHIEWRRIAGFRDVLAHGYFGLDEDIIWDVVATKIPELLEELKGALGD